MVPCQIAHMGYFFHICGRKLPTRGERSDELYVQTHTKVPMDDQAAYSNARVTRDEGREANGWRKEEDGGTRMRGTLKIERALLSPWDVGISKFGSRKPQKHAG